MHKLINSDARRLVKFRAHYTLVNIYGINQNWQLGLQQLSRVVMLAPQITDNEHKKSGLIITSLFYNLIGQFQLAIDATNKFILQKTNIRNKCIIEQQKLLAKLRLALEAGGNVYQQTELKIQLNKEIPKGLNNCELANEMLISKFYSYLPSRAPSR